MDGSNVSMVSADVLRTHFNPARERLWAKIAGLDETLRTLPAPPSDLNAQCRENLQRARACIETRWGHTHLAWRFLHRVDEDLILLLPDHHVRATAMAVRTEFELNITEPAVRNYWLGSPTEKGPLVTAVEEMQKSTGTEISNLSQRHAVREVLGLVNDHVDKGFWVLSMNVLTTLWSALLLAGLMVLFALLGERGGIPEFVLLGNDTTGRTLICIALLGAVGAYVSNLVTKKDFVFVEGGPFTRFLLHPLLVKPVTSAFAAVFVFLLAQSRLLFAILPEGEQATGSGVVLNAPYGLSGYVYAIVAIASGFAADKVLGDMIGGVIRRLEERAEKTRSSPTAETNGAVVSPAAAQGKNG